MRGIRSWAWSATFRRSHLRRGRLLFSIFGRVARQLAIGVLVGSLVSAALFSTADFGLLRSAALLVAVAALMALVALLAALGPARRSLGIQAIDALRTDG